MRGSIKPSCSIALIMATLLSSCIDSQGKLPENAIVSTSLCADGYLHSIPELEPRLAALSWQSRSKLSLTPEHLRHLPQAGNDPETLVKWRQTIQISSAGGQGQFNLSWGEDFETVWKNFALLSAQLNVKNPSGELRARLDAIEKPRHRSRILYLDRSGATAGPGTFVDAVIAAAGGVNMIEKPGWQSPDPETLISLSPDVIVTSFMDSDYFGANDRTSRHAALASKIDSLPVIDIPGRYWPCAGPGLIEATERLNRALLQL